MKLYYCPYLDSYKLTNLLAVRTMCEERWWRLVKYLSQKSQGYTTSPLAARDTLRMVRPLARFCCWCGSKPEEITVRSDDIFEKGEIMQT